jgi:uncharacterized protein YhaN
MKIDRLDLRAYGPFTGRVLDFASAHPGLHVVYGPNEAGKSSALRGLKALLFGVPERTEDCFLHRYDQLLLGGCLREEDGKVLPFFRRKRRKGDLFDEKDNPLDPALLGSFLQGVEQGLFETVYGIDHETLVRGGQEILNQRGDVGQALFAAGAGVTSLRSLLDALEEEADDLFRPKASTKAVNEALSRYHSLQTQLRQSSLTSREWQEHRSALEQAEKALQETSGLLAEKDRERRRLERIRRALPQLGKRADILGRRALMGPVKVLPDDFGKNRRKVEEERREAQIRLEKAAERLSELERKRAGLSLDLGILSNADRIGEMHQRLGVHRKALADRPRLDGMRISHKKSAADLLRQIRPDLPLEQIETLRPGLAKKRTIQTLSSRYEALLQQIEQIGEEAQKQEKGLERLRRELSLLPAAYESGDLLQAIQPARKAGDLDKEIREKIHARNRSLKQCQSTLDRLGLWNGPLEDATKVSVPMAETVDRFEGEFQVLHQKRQELQSDRLKLQEELSRLAEEVRAIEHSGQVPTEADLTTDREKRDQGWWLIRRKWLDGEDVEAEATVFTSGSPLPEVYEGLVKRSDQTADRLRREADRIQKYASLNARMESLGERESSIKGEASSLETALSDAEHSWRELWAACGITPLTPREMRVWLTGFEKLRDQLGEAEAISAEIAALEKRRWEVRESLIGAMTRAGRCREFLGEELGPVLSLAEDLLESGRKEHSRREKMEEKIREIEADLNGSRERHSTARVRLEEWRKEWTAAVAPLGLDPSGSTIEASDFIESLQACFAALKEVDTLEARIQGIDRDAESYRAELEKLVLEVAPDLQGAYLAQAVTTLQERLVTAQKTRALIESHEEAIESHRQEIRQVEEVIAACGLRMVDLLKASGCREEGDLDEAERRSKEYRDLKRAEEEVEATLVEIAEGIPLPELIDQAGRVDPDTLPGRIEELRREIETNLDPEIRRLSETIGREKNEMARMDGNSRSAQIAEDLQQQLAGIRRMTERYIRVKLASRILRDVIERYRAEHQDPVLRLASRYFAELTLGSFSGLRTDTDDQGQPIVVGVRPGGNWVTVDGMSSGTRDQLYLALRVATLQSRLSSGRPMPFVIDDVLINFDDDRSLATLKVLGELGQKNQVILFTHHRRIFDMAQKLKEGQPVFVHEL